MRPLILLVEWAIAGLDLLRACLGCLRFFLTTGASPRYILQRKRWYEESMLGRKMRLREFLEFGAWHADITGQKG